MIIIYYNILLSRRSRVNVILYLLSIIKGNFYRNLMETYFFFFLHLVNIYLKLSNINISNYLII